MDMFPSPSRARRPLARASRREDVAGQTRESLGSSVDANVEGSEARGESDVRTGRFNIWRNVARARRCKAESEGRGEGRVAGRQTTCAACLRERGEESKGGEAKGVRD